MKNKKSIAAFSALQILIFHLWVYISRSEIEMFLRLTAYIGVDIFFFISAYSLSSRNVGNYKSFIINRLSVIYSKFIIFAIIKSWYKHWNILRTIKVICGVEMLEKGGGAYLWFIPAIMIFYISYPLLQHCDKKNRTATIIISCIVWIIIASILTKYKELNHLAIVWNRIPIFYLGYYTNKIASKHNIVNNNKFKLVVGALLLVIGTVLLYNFGFKIKCNTPFINMYYILGIPSSIGLIFMLSNIKEIKPIKIIGEATLELYMVQMTFGYDIVNKLFKVTKNAIETNIISICAIIYISITIHYLFKTMKGKGKKTCCMKQLHQTSKKQ